MQNNHKARPRPRPGSSEGWVGFRAVVSLHKWLAGWRLAGWRLAAAASGRGWLVPVEKWRHRGAAAARRPFWLRQDPLPRSLLPLDCSPWALSQLGQRQVGLGACSLGAGVDAP